jgi:predicted DNA-binding antitoxin AbrB/MazE fold protein
LDLTDGIAKHFIFENQQYIEGGVAKMEKTIEVVYEGGVFKPLKKVELIEGEKMKIKIERGEIIELAKKFSGIGKYKGKLDADKLYQLEVETFG